MNSFLTAIDLSVMDGRRIVEFLLTLTDERVRQEQAPFDHPQLFVPNGNLGDSRKLMLADGATEFEEIPATGAGGRRAAGLVPLGHFLGLDPRQN